MYLTRIRQNLTSKNSLEEQKFNPDRNLEINSARLTNCRQRKNVFPPVPEWDTPFFFADTKAADGTQEVTYPCAPKTSLIVRR